jgi:hypothetical protein
VSPRPSPGIARSLRAVASVAALAFGLPAVIGRAEEAAPQRDAVVCEQAAPCALEENCECVVPGITDRWRAAVCMALEQTDDFEQAGVQRCLNRSQPAAVRTLKPCARNEYWKRQLCQATSRRDNVEACVRDKAFVPAIVARGAGQ